MPLHVVERDRLILKTISERGFASVLDLMARTGVSPSTLRRDIDRLRSAGKLARIKAGIVSTGSEDEKAEHKIQFFLSKANSSTPDAIGESIGKAAAQLCRPGEAIIICGCAATLAMCSHLGSLKLQVLTNSLLVLNVLAQQTQTCVSITGGVVLRDQNIVYNPGADPAALKFHASKIFQGATSVTERGLMQNDVLLQAAEQKLLDHADELVVLVESSKFSASCGYLMCDLKKVAVMVTDDGIRDADAQMIERNGTKLIVAPQVRPPTVALAAE